MPLAGALSMLLSLGGTLMPTQAGDYDQKSPQLSGMVAPNREERHRMMLEGNVPDKTDLSISPAVKFANRVDRRSKDYSGGGIYGRVWAAIIFQIILVTLILFALYYGQAGSVVIWLCTVSIYALNLGRYTGR